MFFTLSLRPRRRSRVWFADSFAQLSRLGLPRCGRLIGNVANEMQRVISIKGLDTGMTEEGSRIRRH